MEFNDDLSAPGIKVAEFDTVICNIPDIRRDDLMNRALLTGLPSYLETTVRNGGSATCGYIFSENPQGELRLTFQTRWGASQGVYLTNLTLAESGCWEVEGRVKVELPKGISDKDLTATIDGAIVEPAFKSPRQLNGTGLIVTSSY